MRPRRRRPLDRGSDPVAPSEPLVSLVEHDRTPTNEDTTARLSDDPSLGPEDRHCLAHGSCDVPCCATNAASEGNGHPPSGLRCGSTPAVRRQSAGTSLGRSSDLAIGRVAFPCLAVLPRRHLGASALLPWHLVRTFSTRSRRQILRLRSHPPTIELLAAKPCSAPAVRKTAAPTTSSRWTRSNWRSITGGALGREGRTDQRPVEKPGEPSRCRSNR